MSIADLRREYKLAGLRRSDLEAISLYKSLLLAAGAEPMDVNAMTLATTDEQGRPSARIVLLKGADQRGFVFLTNYESRKGRELAVNTEAALVFYWAEQERQVCVAGQVSRLSPEESDAYFQSRPRGSRIAACASKQSEVVPNRAALEEQWKQVEAQHAGKDVPRPALWGGYVLRPTRIEFWQGRPNRLHDRFRYTRQADDSWQIERLWP
jgi:pyridoxamine 5'-phosphate oxidase